ncbi:MAG: DNA replication and repair protein RecF [Chloroflexota bacterium]|nr:DNA replication and repair protein RecF [Chloroflexota bacterium]
MYCRRLELVDFRNFAALELDLPAGPLLVLGRNAQGKSNLLEALLALASGRGRSHRTLAELIRTVDGAPRPFARIRAEVAASDRATRLELVFALNPTEDGGPGRRASRRVVVDGKPRRASELLGQLNAVHFSPDDIDLLGGAPAERRRFLDVAISQVDRNYVRDLVDYGRVLSQRNALLRELRERDDDAAGLEFWDGKLVELGGRIVATRQQFVGALNDSGAAAYEELAGAGESLRVEYRLVGAGEDGGLPLDLLANMRTREIQRGQTMVGPHRDDLEMLVDGQPAAAFASRGQQRLVVLSLRLAEMEWLGGVAGESPVLLLDDIFSELDSEHREAVIARMPKGAQVLVTAADDAQVPEAFRSDAAVLRVRAGHADREG